MVHFSSKISIKLNYKTFSKESRETVPHHIFASKSDLECPFDAKFLMTVLISSELRKKRCSSVCLATNSVYTNKAITIIA